MFKRHHHRPDANYQIGHQRVSGGSICCASQWTVNYVGTDTQLKLNAVPFSFQFCSAEISRELHFVPAQQQRCKYLLCCCAPIRRQKGNNSSARRRRAALVSMKSTALYQSLFILLGKALVKFLFFRCVSCNPTLLVIQGCDIPVLALSSVLAVFSSHCYFLSSP